MKKSYFIVLTSFLMSGCLRVSLFSPIRPGDENPGGGEEEASYVWERMGSPLTNAQPANSWKFTADIAIDNGTAYVAYGNEADDEIHVEKWSGGAWTGFTQVQNFEGAFQDPRFAIQNQIIGLGFQDAGDIFNLYTFDDPGGGWFQTYGFDNAYFSVYGTFAGSGMVAFGDGGYLLAGAFRTTDSKFPLMFAADIPNLALTGQLILDGGTMVAVAGAERSDFFVDSSLNAYVGVLNSSTLRYNLQMTAGFDTGCFTAGVCQIWQDITNNVGDELGDATAGAAILYQGLPTVAVTTDDGAIYTYGIYQFDGANWNPLGSAFTATYTAAVARLATDGTSLYLGVMSKGNQGLQVYRWNGSTWKTHGPASAGDRSIRQFSLVADETLGVIAIAQRVDPNDGVEVIRLVTEPE